MKKLVAIGLSMVMCITILSGCGKVGSNSNKETVASVNSSTETEVEQTDEKVNVVTTLFPYYDFIRTIAGDKVNLTLLLPLGTDPHSFDPTAQDMITVEDADVFIYNGGDMEAWVEQVLDAADNSNQDAECMMDYVDTVEEETVAGMMPDEDDSTADSDEGDVEYDEHIWTSVANAEKIVQAICDILSKADPADADYFVKNADTYLGQLKDLDTQFQKVVDNEKRSTIVLGDKFPLRYFADEYGLTYRAAFGGCSSEIEPSAETLDYLIKYVEDNDIPVVFHIELSNCKVADTICEETGAKELQINTIHNVTQEQFDDGVTYLDLMQENVEVLKQALDE